MGEIADDHVEGRCCSWCGMYFAKANSDEVYTHGYPVVCAQCLEESSLEEVEQCGLQPATEELI